MIALALLLGAMPICDDVDGAATRLVSAKQDEFLVQLDVARRQLGAPLLRPKETELSANEQRAIAAERFRAACALSSQPVAQQLSGGDGARLTAILDRPEFSRARDRNPDALLQLLRRIGEWMEELLGQKPAQAFASGVRMFVLILAAFVVGLIAWRLGRARSARAKALAPAPTPGALVLLDPALHLQKARSLAAGNPRDALREALLALLSELERRRLARPDRVKTNRELAAELPTRGANEALSTKVRELLQGYDRTFYSLEPVLPEAARGFADQVEALWGVLSRTASGDAT